TLFACAALAVSAPAERLFVSSDLNHEVLLYDADTGVVAGVFAAPGGAADLDQPHGILARCGDVLVASFGNSRIARFDRDTGAYLGDFAGPGDGLSLPVYLAPGPDGDLYVSSQGNDRIVRFGA